MRKKPTKLDGIAQQLGIAVVEEKLRERIARDQREIAVILSDVDAMAYPDNLLGEMQDALSDKEEIRRVARLWETWIENSTTIKRALGSTLSVIKFFAGFDGDDSDVDW